ncbi:MAG: ABC transporter permease [Spirochaetaceae bacterium]|jgi:peptide/nickel transport system permease protein|nr:ABC transporter permease [Spirochaetaceae bacterium]
MNFIKAALLFFIKAALLLLAVSVIAFALLKKSPIDPVQAYIGADASLSPQQIAKIAERWGVNEDPFQQYIKWLTSVCSGDFGSSIIFRRPVLEVVGERFLASAALMGTAWIFSGFLGFALGTLAAVKRGAWQDKLIKGWCFTLASVPVFWAGLLLMLFFAVKLKIFPLGFAVPAGRLEEATLGQRIYHLILPALTLSITGVSAVVLHTRQKMIDALDSEYALYAAARGETKWRIVLRHGLRNAGIPALTLQFASFSELFGGSVLAEQVFSYPGLGRAVVRAGVNSDAPLLLGITLFSALFVFTGNSIANALYYVLNPEIRKD